MSQAEEVAELLLHWEELAEQGQHVSAEELCRDCPELLDEVRGKMQALRAMDRVPNRIDDTMLQADGRATATEALPRLPGYEVLETIGSGGMGKVYKARQLGLNRLVALKMILSGVHARPAELARFRTEAEAVARLHHPNIVQIYEVGAHDGVPFLALEYVAGGSLEQLLNGQPLQPRRAAELVRTLAEAVHHAHEQGIVHRDLKPANVLLVSGGVVSGEWSKTAKPQAAEKTGATTHHSPLTTHQPKITDFGLAKRLDEVGQTQTGAVLGTPSYMAPEQAEGRVKAIGPATDVYALGAILYELLTGRPPFQADTLIATLEQVRTQEPVPPRQLQAQAPRPLEVICLNCLQKDPALRYPSAAALAADLERFLNGEWVEARGMTVVGQMTRLLNRSQLIVRFRGESHYLFVAVMVVPFLANLGLYLTCAAEPFYGPASVGVSVVATLVLFGVVYLSQQNLALVTSPAVSRNLWSIRIATLLGMLTITAHSYLTTPPGQPWDALAVYPLWSVQSGTFFFVLGGMYWGRMYLAGAAFYVLALLLPLHPPLGPVALAALLTVTLMFMAFKAHALNREEGLR
jgi:serine/threonine protein kinase